MAWLEVRQLTVIQSPHVVRKHAQQVAEADGGNEECQIEEEELASLNLESREKVEDDNEDHMLESDQRQVDQEASDGNGRGSAEVKSSWVESVR